MWKGSDLTDGSRFSSSLFLAAATLLTQSVKTGVDMLCFTIATTQGEYCKVMEYLR